MKFADVKNDIAFRKIFGNESRKEVLISFLNAILGFEGDDRVSDIVIIDPFQLPKLKSGKVSIVDVRATDLKKQQFIVEMQVADREGFAKRVLYYTSKNYVSQIKHADQYRLLKPTYFIGILGFSHTTNPHYINRHRVRDVDTGEVTIKDIDFTFIELEKFNKSESELEALTDKWIYFIKYVEDLEVIPPNTTDLGLLSAYEQANQYSWTQEEIDAYEYVGMREEDARAEYDAMLKKAMKQANEKLDEYSLIFEKSAAELEKSAAELEKSAAELEKSAAELEKSTQELEKSTQELEKAKAQIAGMVKEMALEGMSTLQISKFTKLTLKEIEEIIG